MSSENTLYPILSAGRLAHLLVAFALLLGLAAGQASATSFSNDDDDDGHRWGSRGKHGEWDLSGNHDRGRPWHMPGPDDGISLYDLVVGGESFDSLNGAVSFLNFEAELGRHGDRALKHYTVKPRDHGFALIGPTFSIFGFGQGLEFSYDVEAANGLEIVKVALQVSGFGLHGKSGAKMLLSDEADEELGRLYASQAGKRHHGEGHGANRDKLVLENAVSGLHVDEKLFAKGRLAGTWKTTHDFKTNVIPEPGTALLLGMGLAALGRSRQRQA